MDVLARVRELLSGTKTQKRKSSIAEEYELERKKRSRMSELNGYDVEPHIVNNGLHSDSSASLRNHKRRSDSYFSKNSSKSGYATPGTYNQTNERNDNYSHINFNNGADSQRGEFKQPMPPPSTNGSKKVPNLISATRQAFGHSLFHRGSNQPHQTIIPHYTRFGEPSELENFKSVPDLYPIKANRSNSKFSYSSRNNLDNGHEHSAFSTSRYTPHSNQLSAFGTPSALPSSNLFGNSNSFFNNSVNNRTSNTMSLKGNSIFSNSGDLNPPQNLSRTRYQSMLDMVPGFRFLTKSKKPAVNDTSVQGVIDLSEEANNTTSTSSTAPRIERVNSLKVRLQTKEVFNEDWQQSLSDRYSASRLSRRDSLRKVEVENDECERKTRDTEDRLKESFNKITISSLVVEDEEEEEPANDFPSLDQEKQRLVAKWISGRDTGTTLISKFNLSITRHDIQTLQWNPLTWLNDEVINFYMELLAERSRTNKKLPKVHAMNTFFLKRLQETGYSGVRRWTRKVDIFEHDIIPVPVHKGIHWCMAIIHLKNKTIKYYDSMGAPNNNVLTSLANYLKSESLDKKKVEFDMSDWTVENVRNIPQQENGSDCGVFSCMYAEFITRNRPIVFTQQHMLYFRTKMVYEICSGQMLN